LISTFFVRAGSHRPDSCICDEASADMVVIETGGGIAFFRIFLGSIHATPLVATNQIRPSLGLSLDMDRRAVFFLEDHR
jgi:hypothetical protein